MLNLALFVSTLLAIIILVALIGALGLWMKGIGAVAFPGLGIIIGTQYFFVLLSITEILLVLISAYLVRFLPFVRELTDMIAGIGG